MSAPVVAVVGGGQLARMMQEAANALGIHLRALVEAEDGATAQVVPDSRVGSPASMSDMAWLVDGADVLTFEHEHIPADTLAHLAGRLPIEPSPSALLYAQDKLEMRRRLSAAGIPCPRWDTAGNLAELAAVGERIGFPLIVKRTRGGYDGHGVAVIDRAEDAAGWLDSLADGEVLLVEERVPFDRELAVLLARRRSGEIRCWDVVETEQRDGICSVVRAPAPGLSSECAARAVEVATAIATELDVTGVLAVEMFLDTTGEEQISVNELAMRPHNSGHWTLDGAVTSQFENHLRAVLDLPLGDTSRVAPHACMVNLLGSNGAEPRDAYPAVMAAHPDAKIRYYGKGVRPGRKLGHVTVCGEDADAVRDAALDAVRGLYEGEKK